jgi:hypothetical protein
MQFRYKGSNHTYCIVLKEKGMNRKNITTAFLVSILVGSMLNVINSYDVFMNGDFSTRNTIKVILTYITPFCVSLYSSVRAGKQQTIKTD